MIFQTLEGAQKNKERQVLKYIVVTEEKKSLELTVAIKLHEAN